MKKYYLLIIGILISAILIPSLTFAADFTATRIKYNNINDVAYNGTTCVAVGDNGQILYTSDFVKWNLYETYTSASFRNILWNGFMFIAVAMESNYQDTYIYLSQDGVAWAEPIHFSKRIDILGTGADHELFVCSDLGKDTTFFTTTDFKTFQPVVSQDFFGKMIYKEGKYFAYLIDGWRRKVTLGISSDKQNWKSCTLENVNIDDDLTDPIDIVYNNGTAYVCYDREEIMLYSTNDFEHWTQAKIDGLKNYKKMFLIDGKVYIIGSDNATSENKMVSTEDGIHFEACAKAFDLNFKSMYKYHFATQSFPLIGYQKDSYKMFVADNMESQRQINIPEQEDNTDKPITQLSNGSVVEMLGEKYLINREGPNMMGVVLKLPPIIYREDAANFFPKYSDYLWTGKNYMVRNCDVIVNQNLGHLLA